MLLFDLMWLAKCLAAFSAITCIAYSALQFRFLRHCRFASRLPSQGYAPKAGVILCVRGCDQTLPDALQGLLNQDYPDYTVQVIVDSESDPAFSLIEDLRTKQIHPERLKMSVLRQPRSTCSLKCSSLVQGLVELDSSHEVVAFMDADVVPHATWLRELVDPLFDTGIGVTYGNRWFLPWRHSLVAAARAAWICCTVVVMQQTGLCWGGAMAMRRKTIDQLGLIEQWSNSFNDDILVGDLVRKAGLSPFFIPGVLIVNEGPCGLRQLFEFVRRQLIHTRLAHTHWAGIAATGFAVSGIVPLCVIVLLAGLAVANWQVMIWSGVSLIGYLGMMIVYYRLVEDVVFQTHAIRRSKLQRLGLESVGGISLAAMLHFVALIGAITARTVNWRGIRYHLARGKEVTMEKYEPYGASPRVSK